MTSNAYNDIVTFCGCAILNQSAVAKFFGWSIPSVRKYLADVPSITINGRKYWSATAVAKKMEDESHD